ncbi:ribosomal RNA small subunit methyltransferase C [Enterobacter cloacae]|uniref:Ribosomal RNA small subunit methyltransferase C n=1 Tax=Enterobacter cloacae TaxID=550 RepID=A0A377M6V6_ENTCL|nr:ribosomal RNA small subunit methyltransferase C [Enterobacter cloacae]
MSAFTPASEVLLRHSDDFEESRILFAGDMQDDLPRVSTVLKAVPYPILPPLAGAEPPDGRARTL